MARTEVRQRLERWTLTGNYHAVLLLLGLLKGCWAPSKVYSSWRDMTQTVLNHTPSPGVPGRPSSHPMPSGSTNTVTCFRTSWRIYTSFPSPACREFRQKSQFFVVLKTHFTKFYGTGNFFRILPWTGVLNVKLDGVWVWVPYFLTLNLYDFFLFNYTKLSWC